MNKNSFKAMILAAGYGKRMLPLTNRLPKPLVHIKNKPILHHLIDKLLSQDISEITINTHHLSEKIISYLKKNFNNEFQILLEKEILDTGGGVANAISKKKIGDDNKPFFVINGDVFWVENDKSIFSYLLKNWDNTTMDVLLILIEKKRFFGYSGKGDFDFVNLHNNLGQIENKRSTKKYVYTGLQLVHPRIFRGVKNKKFSFREIFNQAMKKESLFGLIDDHEWFHIGTVEDLNKVKNIL